MNYFVTGGAGFIGREVVHQLLSQGNRVCIYDDFSFGKDFNIQNFIKNSNLSIVKGKIENHLDLRKALSDFQPDKIIHLAALHFIPFCNSNPLGTLRINVEGTASLFESLIGLNIKVKNILVASSGAIYPSTEELLVEDKIMPQPTDIYGLSKLLTEQLDEYYSRKLNTPVVSMRFYNTYGPYETNPHILPDIIEQLRKSDTISLGNVKSKRDYIYVEDISSAIVELSKIDHFILHETVNIGTGLEYSAEELVDTISDILGKKITIEIDKSRLRPVDKMHQRASIDRLTKLSGWKPKTSLKAGLEKLLKFEKLIK